MIMTDRQIDYDRSINSAEYNYSYSYFFLEAIAIYDSIETIVSILSCEIIILYMTDYLPNYMQELCTDQIKITQAYTL